MKLLAFRKTNVADQSASVEPGNRTSRLTFPSLSRSSRRTSPSPDPKSLSVNIQPKPQTSDVLGKAVTASTAVPALPSAPAPEVASQASAVSSQITTHNGTVVDPPVANVPVLSQQTKPDALCRSGVTDFVVGNDLWNNAFREACAGRPDGQREKLAQTKDVRDLFESLQKADQKHEEESMFQKGVGRLNSVLTGLSFLLTLTDPISSIEPCTSSALAIVKMVTAIGIAICGADKELHSQIETFLKDLPRIDFCDAVQSGRSTPASIHGDIIHEALVSVYGDLLDFFFHGYELLNSKVFLLAAVSSTMRRKITTTVADFSGHLEALDRSIIAATKEIVNNLAESDVDREVRELLEKGRVKENEFYNTLSARTADACKWIESDAVFQDWLQVTPGTKYVAMYGDMGCGKTLTVAHVVDFLRSDPRKLVSSYFCKDDGEMNRVSNIFRSLLSQLLAVKASLRWDFQEWYRARQGRVQVDPTQAVDELRALLVKLVTSLRQPVYIVIDGLDECRDEARTVLFDFFEKIRQDPGQSAAGPVVLPEKAGLVRLFTSSRYANHSRIPSGTATILVPNDAQRDLYIVRYLSLQHFRDLEEQTRELITNEVAVKMQGSGIWARMVLQVLQNAFSITTPETAIKRKIHGLPPPQELSELYAELFEKVIVKNAENRWILARSLDLMAAARRQLTLRELSYAVRIEYAASERAKSLGEMTEADDYMLILGLVRPFISIEESLSSPTSPTAYMRLIHQSLKEVIMSQPPWSAGPRGTRDTNETSRDAELNGLVLRLCIDYLLLPEFDTQVLEPDQELQTAIYDLGHIQLDQDSEKDVDVGEDFDPYSKGFGGFYTYAACYWVGHYEGVTRQYTPKLKDLITLSQPGSIRLKNWLDRMRQPDWGVDLERSLHRGYNPLTLVARFGSEAALEELLDQGLPALGLADEEPRTSAIMSAAEQAINDKKSYVVKVLLNHPTTISTFQDETILIRMASKWKSLEPLPKESWTQWTQLIELMIEKSRDMLTHYANFVLLEVARIGCLPIVESLFEAATTDEQIRNSLLQKTSSAWGPIGLAGQFGHVEIMRYLCKQTGIEAHLHHKDPFGDNIYHIVALNGNPEALRVLIQYFPEGVNQANGSTTPLQIAVNEARNPEAARVLLLEGKADINAGLPSALPLIRCAVHNGTLGMCRTLIVQGNANPWTIVGVRDGVPFLNVRNRAPWDQAHRDERDTLILREVCSLMPLAVPVSLL